MKRINSLAELTAALALLALSALMLINVFARNVIRQSFIGTETLAVYFMIWITFIGAAVIILQYGHVSVDFFLRMARTREGLSRAIGLLTVATALVISGFFIWYGAQLAYQLFMRGGRVATLGISQGYIYAFITVAMVLMFCNALILGWRLLIGDRSSYPGDYLQDDAP
ncbi:TRAP transporter small permease [Castellaniella sp.]|uniref:TRAP transporter small permease n=1 Tax=Castellaniella sp. TaxID=1955812 RepID=UPI00355E53BB